MVVFFFLFWTRSRDTRYNGKIERAKESDWHKINTVARNRKKRLVIGAWIVAAMHRLEKADLRVERLRGALRSSRGSVKGRVKNNRANRKGRRRDRLRPFENSSCDFFFFPSPLFSSFSFFFFFSTAVMARLKPERDSVETLITSCWPLAADISATRRVRRLGFGPVIAGSTAHRIYYGRSTPARIICNKL